MNNLQKLADEKEKANRELLDCLKEVVDNLMLDFPDDHFMKKRYQKAIDNVQKVNNG